MLMLTVTVRASCGGMYVLCCLGLEFIYRVAIVIIRRGQEDNRCRRMDRIVEL